MSVATLTPATAQGKEIIEVIGLVPFSCLP